VSDTNATYTVKGFMEATGLSRTTVYKLIREERIKTIRIGKRVLILGEVVKAMAEGDVKSKFFPKS